MVVNDPAFFLSHRLPVALGAREAGYDVHIATAPGDAVDQVKRHNLPHHSIPISRSGQNPFSELLSVIALLRLFRSLRPDAIHLVTIKPVLYGGIAARLAGIHATIAAVSGLGSVFVANTEQKGLLRRLVESLYRIALGHSNTRVIFQNQDDLLKLLNIGAIDETQARVIRGSGTELSEYQAVPEPDGPPKVVMAARLLEDKGVYVFVAAARILHERGVNVRFQLAGEPDPSNPRSVSEEDLNEWRNEGIVELLGFRSDVARLFSESHIITLPSYYGEGLPKVLIEAAACGRAVVTTDHPGCRDAITPDESGLLVPVRDPEALADAIQYLIENPEQRHAMGRAGRKLAEEVFDVHKVVEQHLKVYEELLTNADK